MEVCYVILIIAIIVLAFVIWYNGKKWKNMYKFNGGGGGYFSDATGRNIGGTIYYCYEYTCFIYSISQSNGNTILVLKVGGGGSDNGYLLYNEPNIHITYRNGKKTNDPNGIITNDYARAVYNGVYDDKNTSPLGLLRPDLAYTPFQRNYNGVNINLNRINVIQYGHNNALNATIVKNDNNNKCFIKTENTAIKFVAFHIYTTDANTSRGLCIEVNELEDKIVDFIKKNFHNVTCHSDANIAKWATTTNKTITQSDDGENFIFWNDNNIALTTNFNRIVEEIETGMLDILCENAPTVIEKLSTMQKSIFIKRRALEQIQTQIKKLNEVIAKPQTLEDLNHLTQKLQQAQIEEAKRKIILERAIELERKQAREREQAEARERERWQMDALKEAQNLSRAERANRRRPREQPKKQDRKRDRSNSRDRKRDRSNSRDRDMYDY